MKENDSVASLSILQHADLTACFPGVQFDLRELAKIAGLRAIGIFIHQSDSVLRLPQVIANVPLATRMADSPTRDSQFSE